MKIKNLFIAIIAFTLLNSGFSTFAKDKVVINHLGVNNTLVRIYENGNYLLLPVQETVDNAKINVLVDGKISETIYVRLAKSKTDYKVPFDLLKYKGKNVILDIVSPQDRSSIREAKEDVCWKELEIIDKLDFKDLEKKFRPIFHHAPLYGWMNDPNGMFYKDGKWHLYYQYNPYGSKWQNMTWGHSVSSDLINWKTLPNAIIPDALGAIFSGSAAIDKNNSAGFGKDAIVALYTSAGVSQMQSMASSNDDGTTFDIYAGNPIITLESEARDPKIFWNENSQEWNLVLAHSLDHEMLFFSSSNLKEWKLLSSFGKGLGEQSGVWECPDLFELPVLGSESKKWVLLCNINPGGPFGGSGTQYFIGDWDGKIFTANKDKSGNVPTKWLDFGKDHYATVSWNNAPKGRRTVIGWMSNWQYAADVPTMQYRSANTLPRDISLFKAEDGQIYASSEPSPELLKLRDKPEKCISKATIGKNKVAIKLPYKNDGICEISTDIISQDADSITMILSNNYGDKVVMAYNPKSRKFLCDRRNSGIVSFSQNFPAITVTPTFETTGKISLRIFIDKSSIEIFGNNGKFVMTNLVFPNEPYTTLTISSNGGKAKINNFKIYPLSKK